MLESRLCSSPHLVTFFLNSSSSRYDGDSDDDDDDGMSQGIKFIDERTGADDVVAVVIRARAGNLQGVQMPFVVIDERNGLF